MSAAILPTANPSHTRPASAAALPPYLFMPVPPGDREPPPGAAAFPLCRGRPACPDTRHGGTVASTGRAFSGGAATRVRACAGPPDGGRAICCLTPGGGGARPGDAPP